MHYVARSQTWDAAAKSWNASKGRRTFYSPVWLPCLGGGVYFRYGAPPHGRGWQPRLAADLSGAERPPCCRVLHKRWRAVCACRSLLSSFSTLVSCSRVQSMAPRAKSRSTPYRRVASTSSLPTNATAMRSTGNAYGRRRTRLQRARLAFARPRPLYSARVSGTM